MTQSAVSRRTVSPMAYFRPLMDLINELDRNDQNWVMNKVRAQGVASGMNKDATPEQRKQVMLWAEQQWPDIVADLESWPKPSLAARFAAAEARKPGIGRTQPPSDSGKTQEQYHPLRPDARASFFLQITCVCGNLISPQNVEAGQSWDCEHCGYRWTLQQFRLVGSPAASEVVFGGDTYRGSSVRNAKITPPSPLTYRSVGHNQIVDPDENPDLDVGHPTGREFFGGFFGGAYAGTGTEPSDTLVDAD